MSDVADQTDKSLGELFGDLSTDLRNLVSQELRLARAEVTQEVAKAGKAGGLLGAGAFTGYLAVVLLSFAAAWGLSEVVPEGVAFLVVGLVYAVVAAVLLLSGRKKVAAVSPAPTQTVETLKEDVEWAKNRMP